MISKKQKNKSINHLVVVNQVIINGLNKKEWECKVE